MWNPFKHGVIKDLEKVQKRATKCLKGFATMSYKERLIRLQLPTLKHRRLRGVIIEDFKIVTHYYSEVVAPELARSVNLRTRGSVFKLHVARCRLDVRKYSFCERVVNMWNSLPNWVVEAKSLNVFNLNFDKFCRNKEMLYNY